MPRRKGDKDEDKIKDEDLDIVQHDIEKFIEQFLEDHCYWKRKGCKLHCSLCNFNVQFSSFAVLKNEITSHTKSKRHKKKFEVYEHEKNNTKNAEVKKKAIKKNETIVEFVKEVDYNLSRRPLLTNKNCRKFHSHKQQPTTTTVLINGDSDFEAIYPSLDKKNNPVTQISKKYIVKANDDKNYFCTLCQEVIFIALNPYKFRYNLWIHLNNQSHCERLPNFSILEEHFKKVIKDLSKQIPPSLEGDLKYFKIGPVFRFVECSLCNVAVSENLHRLENHIVDKYHKNRKLKESNEFSNRSKIKYLSIWYSRFISEMETKFKESQFIEDIMFIHIGCMPGYVVCSLCAHVVLPTFFYLESHFKSGLHVKNKEVNLINYESRHETDMMKQLQASLGEFHSAFEETKYGTKCHQCCCFIPPISYALYCHVSKYHGVNPKFE